jgi:hypothetical protein
MHDFMYIVFFFSLSCFHLVRKNGLCYFYVLHGMLDFMSMTLSLCISFTNKEWFTFFSFCIPCLILCHVLLFFHSLLHRLQTYCWAWHRWAVVHSWKTKNSNNKTHHNLIPSPTTLSHTHSEHSSPLSPSLLPETSVSHLDPAGFCCATPPNCRPGSVYRSCWPVSRAA